MAVAPESALWTRRESTWHGSCDSGKKRKADAGADSGAAANRWRLEVVGTHRDN